MALLNILKLLSDSEGISRKLSTAGKCDRHSDISVNFKCLTRLIYLCHKQLKLFHSELLAQLEQKLELDIKYLTVSPHTDYSIHYITIKSD